MSQLPIYRPADGPVDTALDDFVHRRSNILNTKLEVLALEIWSRFVIRSKNLDRVTEDREKLTEMLGSLDRLANYHLRDQSEKGQFYRALFDLAKQERDEDVACWNDIVRVMNDLLTNWEAHEQSAARARLLEPPVDETQSLSSLDPHVAYALVAPGGRTQ